MNNMSPETKGSRSVATQIETMARNIPFLKQLASLQKGFNIVEIDKQTLNVTGLLHDKMIVIEARPDNKLSWKGEDIQLGTMNHGGWAYQNGTDRVTKISYEALISPPVTGIDKSRYRFVFGYNLSKGETFINITPEQI